jgi:hypothetical protein
MTQRIVDMSDRMTMEPNIAKPEESSNWVWCRWGAHWSRQNTSDFKRSRNQGRIYACSKHNDEYALEYNRRRKIRLAETMERTAGAGKAGVFSIKDYTYYVFHSHTWRPIVPVVRLEWPGRSSLDLPGADDELLCGCVPGWPHGSKCGDGLSGQMCERAGD